MTSRSNSRSTSSKIPPSAPAKDRAQREAPKSSPPDTSLGDNLDGGETDFADFEDAEPEWGESMPSDLVPRHDQDD
jgi:hypothetical protein